jgi:hypothetical protein
MSTGRAGREQWRTAAAPHVHQHLDERRRGDDLRRWGRGAPALFRVDSAKVNLLPPSAATQWFKLVSVNLGNGTEIYPSGDEVQTVERWTPPKTFEGFSTADLNKAIDRLRAGMDDGRRYSTAASARTRAAWRVLQEICPAQTEARCREVIKTRWKTARSPSACTTTRKSGRKLKALSEPKMWGWKSERPKREEHERANAGQPLKQGG